MSKRRMRGTALRLNPDDGRREQVRVAHADIARAVRRYSVGESVGAATVERTAVHEATVGGARIEASGRMAIRLIRAGWSLNNTYYPAEVLRRDGATAWPKGTQAFVDHATDAEEASWPAGTVKNLAAVLTTDARWDEAEQALIAEVRLFHPWRETLTDMADTIGMSIRAWVTGEQGEAEGREGFVVQSIPQGRSVDFVTVPAAGGGIISVLESVGNHVPTQETRNAGHWFEARIHSHFSQLADEMFGEGYLSREDRITLSGAVGDALAAFAGRIDADAPHLYQRDPFDQPAEPTEAMVDEARRRVAEAPTEETRTALIAAVRAAHLTGDDSYAWVRDFDPDRLLVWFEAGDSSVSKCWQQGYAAGANGVVVLVGEPVEVVARISYEPANAPSAGAAESAPPTPTATTVAENVTDGVPPTAPNPPIEKEPAMSGTETGAPPVQAGTAPVVDAPVTTTVLEAPRNDSTTAALEAVTERLTQMQEQFAAMTARGDQRDAENRTLRNNNRATEAVVAALRATDLADVAGQIGPRVTSRILAAVPTTGEGVVDEAALTEAITTAVTDEAGYLRTERARALESAGVGQPYGLGATKTEAPDDGFETEMKDFFGGVLGMTTEQASIASKGRN